MTSEEYEDYSATSKDYDKGKEVQVIVMVKRNIMQIQSLPLQGGR